MQEASVASLQPANLLMKSLTCVSQLGSFGQHRKVFALQPQYRAAHPAR